MAPAVAIAWLATVETDHPPRDRMWLRSSPFQFTRFLDMVTDRSARRRKPVAACMVTAALGQQCQCQKRLVMHGIEVHCFVKTLFGTPTVAGRLADHAHQVIGRWRKALEPKVAFTGRDGVVKPALVGQRQRPDLRAAVR